MENILVTGGAGFIGSCFVRGLARSGKRRVVTLDALTYAGNLDNLKEVEDNPHHRFVKGDIQDRTLLARLFAEEQIDAVVNFAAESHVDRSIRNPEIFLRTNILGTQALLDAAMADWKEGPVHAAGKCRPGVKFVQVSTDEVYGALGDVDSFTEDTPLAPNSPYSASKAGADLLVRAYHRTFGLPASITRCSNNGHGCDA